MNGVMVTRCFEKGQRGVEKVAEITCCCWLDLYFEDECFVVCHDEFSREIGPDADQSNSSSRPVGDDGDSPYFYYCSGFLIL